YLGRRLLANGAKTSFVHQIADPAFPIEELGADPLATLPEPYQPDPRIPLPRAIYPGRPNSLGVDLARSDVLAHLAAATQGDRAASRTEAVSGIQVVHEPGNAGQVVGTVALTARLQLDAAIDRAHGAFDEESTRAAAARAALDEWSARPAAERAAVLERAGDGFEAGMRALVSVIVREGGRTYGDAVAEVREAADFFRDSALQ